MTKECRGIESYFTTCATRGKRQDIADIKGKDRISSESNITTVTCATSDIGFNITVTVKANLISTDGIVRVGAISRDGDISPKRLVGGGFDTAIAILGRLWKDSILK